MLAGTPMTTTVNFGGKSYTFPNHYRMALLKNMVNADRSRNVMQTLPAQTGWGSELANLLAMQGKNNSLSNILNNLFKSENDDWNSYLNKVNQASNNPAPTSYNWNINDEGSYW
jgi:hypothetical protein